jgi:hypothetical protein
MRNAFAQFDRDRIQALIVWPTPLMLLHRRTILASTSHRIPVIGEGPELAHAGALLSYSADYVAMWGHAAMYVAKSCPVKDQIAALHPPNRHDQKLFGLATARSSAINLAKVT